MRLLHLDKIPFTLEHYNDHFLLLKNDDYPNLASIGEAIYKSRLSFIEEVIATEKEIYIKLNENYSEDSLNQLSQIKEVTIPKQREIRLPIYFNEHEDWNYIETYTSLNKAQYISKLLSLELSVAMLGFLPGFVYINGLTDILRVPRKSNPSVHIPKNSLAVGRQYLGIYSLPSPGGWHVIGEVLFPIIDFSSIPPIFINTNDTIKFIEIQEHTIEEIKNQFKNISEYNGIT